jgi:hypothetical protein
MHIRLVCAQGEEEHRRLLVIARGGVRFIDRSLNLYRCNFMDFVLWSTPDLI